MVGHFFLFKIKIFKFKMSRNLALTFRFMNASTWLDWKLILGLTSESFASFSAWFWDCFKLNCLYIQILPWCFCFNWMVIVECYLTQHFIVNWSSQQEPLIVWEQLLSFDPCHYLLPLIQIPVVNKLITNDETQGDNNYQCVTTYSCKAGIVKSTMVKASTWT